MGITTNRILRSLALGILALDLSSFEATEQNPGTENVVSQALATKGPATTNLTTTRSPRRAFPVSATPFRFF